MTVKLVETKIDDGACGQKDDLAGLEEGKAELLLFTGVPRRYQVSQSRVNTTHCDPKEDSKCYQFSPRLYECSTEGDEAEAERCDGKEWTGSTNADKDRRGQLEDYAADGEDENGDRVSVSSESQVLRHGGDGGR